MSFITFDPKIIPNGFDRQDLSFDNLEWWYDNYTANQGTTKQVGDIIQIKEVDPSKDDLEFIYKTDTDDDYKSVYYMLEAESTSYFMFFHEMSQNALVGSVGLIRLTVSSDTGILFPALDSSPFQSLPSNTVNLIDWAMFAGSLVVNSDTGIVTTGTLRPGNTKLRSLARWNGINLEPYSTIKYCNKEDIFSVYGKANVEKWADIDNTQESDKINNRIEYMILEADEFINTRLYQGPYDIPFSEPIPAIIRGLSSRWTGWLLYQSRGITDNEPDENQLTTYRSYVIKTLQHLLFGGKRIPNIRRKQHIPDAFGLSSDS